MGKREVNSNSEIKRRILVFAGTKVGKTWTIAKIIEDVRKQNPEAKFYILDTEDGWPQSVELMPELLKVPDWYVSASRKEFKADFKTIRTEITKRYRESGKVQDWLFVDSISDLWELVQVDYAKEIWGEDIGEKFLEMRKAAEEKFIETGEKGEVRLDGWQDWAQMKKLHNTDLVDKMKRLPCNWVITAKAKEVMPEPSNKQKAKGAKDIERALIRETFGDIGFKPEGEWQNAFRVDSIWFLHKKIVEGNIRYFITSIGERGRIEFRERRIPRDMSAYDVWKSWRRETVPALKPDPESEASLEDLLNGV